MTQIPLAELPERYAFLDPASGRQPVKATRARSAIVVIAADALGRIFVLSAWAERCSTDHLIDTFVETNERWRPRLFGVEANAMQTLFADALRREARLRNARIPIVPIHQPTHVDKDFRIRSSLQPIIGSGRLFLADTHHAARSELTSFPFGRTKDIVDALASAVALVPPRAMRRQRDAETNDRLAYLRETGAPGWYIDKVASGAH